MSDLEQNKKNEISADTKYSEDFLPGYTMKSGGEIYIDSPTFTMMLSKDDVEYNNALCIKVEYKKGPKFQGMYQATSFSAGADLKAKEDMIIPAGEVSVVGTDLFLNLTSNVFAYVYGRSGLSLKGISLANSVGVIDSDYRGEVKVALRNFNKGSYKVKAGDRIAQIIFSPRYNYVFTETDSLGDTDRGEGGFGSSGR